MLASFIVPGVYSASPARNNAPTTLQASAGWIKTNPGGAGSAVTSLDLCPIESFREALTLVGSVLPNATERAGGFDAIVSHYEDVYGRAVCPGFQNDGAWPESQRLSKGRPGLIINAGEGTTGTRCFHQVFRKLNLSSGHYSHALRKESVWKCTNDSWSADADCTAAYDAYDVVSDTPVAYQLPYVLSSHPGPALAGALLTVRDPHDWAVSRLKHSAVGKKHPRPTQSFDMVNAVPCGCRVGTGDLALPGTAQNLVDQGCAPLDEVSTSVASMQRTLIYDAWAACTIKEAGHPVFLLNPFELTVQEQAAQLASALKGLGAFPASLEAAQIEAAMHADHYCPGSEDDGSFLTTNAAPVPKRVLESASSTDKLVDDSLFSEKEWNMLAIDGRVDLAAETQKMQGQHTDTPSDRLFDQLLAACDAGLEQCSEDRQLQLNLAGSLMYVPLPSKSSDGNIELQCPAEANSKGARGVTGSQPYKWTGQMMQVFERFRERNPDVWDEIIGQANVSVVAVGHDSPLRDLLDSSDSEKHSRMVAKGLSAHVLWPSGPMSFETDVPACNHLVPTPWEARERGFVVMEQNKVYTMARGGGRGSFLTDVPSFEKRIPKVFFRGTKKYSDQRRKVFALGKLEANKAWLDAAENDQQPVGAFGQHKYVLDIGGLSGTTWNALRNKFRMGSLVFRVDSPFADWWHSGLVAGKHYVPVKSDMSDLQAQFEWAESHPDEAKRIAAAGMAIERKSSGPQGLDQYVATVLRSIVATDASLCGSSPSNATQPPVTQTQRKLQQWRDEAMCCTNGSAASRARGQELCYSAKARAKWLVEKKGLSQEEAKLQVINEFPGVFAGE